MAMNYSAFGTPINPDPYEDAENPQDFFCDSADVFRDVDRDTDYFGYLSEDSEPSESFQSGAHIEQPSPQEKSPKDPRLLPIWFGAAGGGAGEVAYI